MTPDQFQVSYDIIDITDEVTDTSQYAIGFFTQIGIDGVPVYRNSVECTSIWDETEMGSIFYEQIKYQNCPATGSPILLQNNVQVALGDNTDQTYYFIVEYCANAVLLGISERTDCKTIIEAQEKANDLVV